MTSANAKSLALPDGRIVGYAEHGDLSGIPVFYFHGTPGSRLELGVPGVDALLARHGLRCLGLDRPGIGLSTPRPKRRIIDWPADVASFADQLGIRRFGVLAVSGGAPYALACGASIPERLLAIGVVSGLGPPGDGPGGQGFARWMPTLLKREVRRFAHRVGEGVNLLYDRFPDLGNRDRDVLADPAWGEALGRSWNEALRQGIDGLWWDWVLRGRPWEFDLGAVQPVVRLWFGEADAIVPPTVGRALSQGLSRSIARLYAEEGHFSILANRMGEVVSGLAAALKDTIAAGGAAVA